MNKLFRSVRYSKRAAWLMLMLTAAVAAGCGGGGGGRDPVLGGSGGFAELIPSVTAVSPANEATGVSVNTRIISAVFNKAMDPASLTASSFTLACPAGTGLAGAVAYTAASNTATLTLPQNLPGNTRCSATVTTAAKDPAGNALSNAFVWSFVTGAVPDTTPPTVNSTVPNINAVDVETNTSITASFSEAMNPATINTDSFTVACPTGTAVAGTVTYAVNGNVATFTPGSNLPNNTVCTGTISSLAKDVAGNALVTPYSWNFTTAALADTIAPTVLGTVPGRDATGVALNSSISVSFSEAMTPLNMTTQNFLVSCPAGTGIAGTVAYAANSNTMTFTPGSSLPGNTVCNVTIVNNVADLAGNTLVADYTWSFTTGPAPDTQAPTVSSTVPFNNATGVASNRIVTASFSEALNPATIDVSSFTVACPSSTPITGSVNYITNGSIASFASNADLPASTLCTATITTAVQDVAGNSMVSPFVWTFTTGVVADTTRPNVTTPTPANNAVDVAVNALVTAAFSEPMDASSIVQAGTFTLNCPAGSPVTGTVSYANNGNLATFDPDADLPASTLCQATISTNARDVALNTMAVPFTWSFTTGAAPDLMPPTVTLRNPDNLATNVPLDASVNATFSEAMNPLSITSANFTVSGVAPVIGQVQYNAQTRIATFTPESPLAAGTDYTATVTTGVQDVALNNMLLDDIWTFRTAAEIPVPPAASVDMGLATSFAIAATAGLTNAPTMPMTVINGDVVLDPNQNCNSVNVPNDGTFGLCAGSPPVLNGQVITNTFPNTTDSAAIKADLNEAYLSITPPAGPPAVGTLAGGMTIAAPATMGAVAGSPDVEGDNYFTAGVYTAPAAMNISGDLILDGQGNANARFVFQAGSSITLEPGAASPAAHTRIILRNGAKASNVWWQVGSSATIGTFAEMQGNVLSAFDITMQNGATSCGRMMAGAWVGGSGALVFEANVVSIPDATTGLCP